MEANCTYPEIVNASDCDQTFLPCSSCNMFQLVNQHEPLTSRRLLPQLSNGKINWVCFNCNEKSSLLSSLTRIRVLEDDLDDLSQRFENCVINCNEDEMDLQEVVVVSNDQSFTSSKALTNETAQTSVWTCETMSNISKSSIFSNSVLNKDSLLNLSSKHTIPEENSVGNKPISLDGKKPVSQITDKKDKPGKNSIEVQQTIGDVVSDIFETSSENDGKMSSTQINLSKVTEYENQNTSNNKELLLSKYTSKFQRGNNVTTLLVGDSVFKNLRLSSDLVKEDEFFKVAMPGATVLELINSALFFVENLHTEVKNIVLQVSLASTKFGKSEKIKEQLHEFVMLMDTLGIIVIICGPVPYRRVSNEAFSRGFTLSKWLTIQCQSYNNCYFVDNFDLLENRENVFSNEKNELSSFGNWLLEEAINYPLMQSD